MSDTASTAVKPSLKTLMESYPGFFAHCLETHTKSSRPHRGHGYDHDIVVAALALKIAPDDEPKTAEDAALAAMLHSFDRLVERGDVTAFEGLVDKALEIIPNGHVSVSRKQAIRAAALRHAELNQGDQSLTQQILMDADRLANLMATVIIRAGQFLPEIPPLEFNHLDPEDGNPAATYHKPCSVLDDLRTNISEYVPRLRVAGAIALGRQYAVQLRGYIELIASQHDDLGLAGLVIGAAE